MSKTENTAGAVGIMALAAVAGAAVALLFAPRKGSETRAHLKQKLRDSTAKSHDAADEIRDKVNEAAKGLKSRKDEVATDVGDTITDAKSQIEDAAADTRARVKRS